MTRAVVFAYHDVGVRCLMTLLATGIDVRLVVSHEDNPQENIWFGSVRALCADYGIECIAPDNPNTPEVLARVRAQEADFLFSFYYRHMLGQPLLEAVRQGAYNMHGSLLPRYRGRVPINWAILHGERETGATLHRMTVKPDDGDIVDQCAVPILPDDTAQDVFRKVTVAAEICLSRALPGLIAGTARLRPQDPSQASYFGRRGPDDGRIDWQQSARRIHDLVRAVTHPYPGAFCDMPEGRLVLWRTRVEDDRSPHSTVPRLEMRDGRLLALPAGGGVLRILEADFAGQSIKEPGDLPRTAWQPLG